MDSLPKFGIEYGYLYASNDVLINCGNIGSKTGNGNIKRNTYLPKNSN